MPRIPKTKPKQQKPEPIWAGPESNADNGGITFSLLSRWLCCRERARLLLVEGLRPTEGFNHRIEYGNMWHCCEEALASGVTTMPTPKWEHDLIKYCQGLCKQYQLQQEQVQHWYRVCKAQFPIYVEHWSKHQDVKDRTPLMQEQVFHVPYQLPSGRTVYLRGKFDSVDLIGKGKNAGVYLQENKSRGDVNELQLKNQLRFDLQVMIYLAALREYDLAALGNPALDKAVAANGGFDRALKGVRYNVIRRPLAGGKHSIRKHQPNKKNPRGESDDEFYQRLAGLIKEEPEFFFMRFKCEVLPEDIERFKVRCLNPILEQLCQWWDHISEMEDPFLSIEKHGRGVGIHWQTPFGYYDSLREGGGTDLDEFMESGSLAGLERTETLFRELQ